MSSPVTTPSGSPLVDDLDRVYTRFENAMKSIPGKFMPSQTVDHSEEADPDAVKAANKTFVDKANQKAVLPAKPNLKPAPRKR